ncbi:MAG: hypothetical protein AB7I01_02530 [Gammaproteobacteria bacterium]
MARLQVLVPHLFRGLATGGAEDGGWAAWLARGELLDADPEFDVDAAVLAWFGRADSEGVAALRAAADLPQAPTAHWLCLDPVHLRADPTRLVMFDVDAVGLEADEADALLEHLRRGLGASFDVRRGAAPGRWYLRLDAPLTLPLPPPRALRGLAVETHLGALRRARDLNRLITETQMLLYEAPVNQARAAAGRAPINSLWPWGGGAQPRLVAPPAAAVLGEDALLAACAAAAKVPHHAALDGLSAALTAGAHELLLLDHFEPADGEPARATARLLAPLTDALARGRLDEVLLRGHRAAVRVTRAARWRLWRRASAFRELLRARVLADD